MFGVRGRESYLAIGPGCHGTELSLAQAQSRTVNHGGHCSGMALEVEDSVAGFLGVHIHHDKEKGLIELTQRGLITRIIEALELRTYHL